MTIKTNRNTRNKPITVWIQNPPILDPKGGYKNGSSVEFGVLLRNSLPGEPNVYVE